MSLEDNNRWIYGICIAGAVAWMGWLSIMVIGMNSQLAVQSMQHENVIPPVIEASLRELRDKTNGDRELILKLTEIATSNSKDIGYLREQGSKKP